MGIIAMQFRSREDMLLRDIFIAIAAVADKFSTIFF